MSSSLPSSPRYAQRPTVLQQDRTVPEQQSALSQWHRVTRWLPNFSQLVTRSEADMLLFSTAVKLLLFPAYHSTDFEVHRNWLAITYSLPISRWYFDTTSQWTLDYPPFFAYFERFLSIPASFIDSKIVNLYNLNYDAWSVVAYQRSTVILTEVVLGVAALRFIRGSVDPSQQRILSASLFFHPGFLIIDHIHFQYNGFMFGILLWSILMAREGRKLACGLFFAILLNFKHIYMYLAPAYFIYLLRSHCMSLSGEILPTKFISLANTVILVFGASLGPFVLMGHLPQLMSRLFPFTRGLNHAYWAPNAWALVTAIDRVLLQLARRFGMNLAVNQEGVVSTSRGLVGDTTFAVLPTIQPIHTFMITIMFQMVFLVKLWKTPNYKSFLTALTLCGYTSYMFGWHVHEKAILLVLVPLSLLATDDYAHFKTYMIVSISGIFSLFPLLFAPSETFVKVIYSLIWGVMVLLPLHKQVYEFPTTLPYVIVEQLENVYLLGFAPLLGLTLTFPLVFDGNPQVEFLPLMMTSVYCAFGLVWGFVRLGTIYLRQ